MPSGHMENLRIFRRVGAVSTSCVWYESMHFFTRTGIRFA